MLDVPRWPMLLGIAGLLPQLACLAIAFLGPDAAQHYALAAGAFYAGTIFTFLGGTWWGIAAGAPAAERRGGLAWLWIAAVIPALFAFACLGAWAGDILPLEPVLVMLGAAILIALGLDSRIGALAPRWWMNLRTPLSVGLGASTIALAFA